MSRSGGPDQTGYYHDDLADFGFNRLAIMDVSINGKQPVSSPSGRYIIMFNGEIYNFKELIKEYSLNGIRSGSDVEVLAHLVERIDFVHMLSLLNGMFSLSVWDKHEKLLYLARDFAGIKPLFYSITKSGFIFSSQYNQIVKYPWLGNWNWSVTGLSEYFQLGYMSAPDTVIEEIKILEPGFYGIYNANTATFTRKEYKLLFEGRQPFESRESAPETVEHVHALLLDIVKSQLVADVPVGIFLSGGIDSALIAALSSRFRPDIKTITVGFEDQALDESDLARKYANFLNIENHTVSLSQNDVLNTINEHNRSITEPFADYSSIPMYLASKVASADFKVMLSGDGGDELFWGYPRYRQLINSRYILKVKSYTGRSLLTKWAKKSGIEVTSKVSAMSLGEANLLHHSMFHADVYSQLFEDNIEGSDKLRKGFHFTGTDKVQILDYLRKNDFYYFMQKVLTKVDRASMSNGLEVRVPFLDGRLLNFVEKIKPDFSIRHDTLKFVTKKILSQYLPDGLISHTKKGFVPPLANWSKSILYDEINEMLMNMDACSDIPVNGEVIRAEWSKFVSGNKANIDGIWAYFMLLKWHNNNFR